MEKFGSVKEREGVLGGGGGEVRRKNKTKRVLMRDNLGFPPRLVPQ